MDALLRQMEATSAPGSAITAARPGRNCRWRKLDRLFLRGRMIRGARPTALVLTGPTGSGKSDWALRLAGEMPIEIVSVDSAQVFRGMDIGTAKPTAADRARVAHHLIDIRDPPSALGRRIRA